MATAALPIRELSADVQFQAADAQKTVLSVVESKRRGASFIVAVLVSAVVHLKVLELNKKFERLADSQWKLIDSLQQIPVEQMSSADFTKVADDLGRIVADTNSVIDDSYAMPEKILRVWRANLEVVQNRASHLESIAESFRIAADDTCTALLADVARNMMATERIHA